MHEKQTLQNVNATFMQKVYHKGHVIGQCLKHLCNEPKACVKHQFC
jgi:hypothetical protein